jgi:Holliday junction resolvase RusA-like endonuclease
VYNLQCETTLSKGVNLNSRLVFTVPGVPIPKQSFRCVLGGPGQKVRGYTPERVTKWRDTVILFAKVALASSTFMTPSLENFEAWFYFTLPDYRRRDLDNLSKNIMDALKGVVWVDDTQVYQYHVEKRVTKEFEPGIIIVIDRYEYVPWIFEWDLKRSLNEKTNGS